MKPRLKICWTSNGVWAPSGYGNVSADMYDNFRAAGWSPETFAFIDMYGLQGGVLTDHYGFKHYPLMDHQFGSDAMLHHGRAFGADVIISLLDVWVQNPQDLSQLSRWIPWAPIDYNPVPPPLLTNLRFANRIIAMSKFGQEQLKENGMASTFIPHGVNTRVFYPMDKVQRKIDLKIDPKTFIFGMVGANKEAINPRKAFQQVLDAFKQFLLKKPKSLLYIHTDPDMPGGFPLRQYANFLGIGASVAFPERYKMKYDTGKPEMNLIYNSFDCLLAPSASEGFNIPVIEAQATGTPVIVNDWTSMPEMIIPGVTGYATAPGAKIYYPIGSYFCYPEPQSLLEKMHKITDMQLGVMGKSASAWIEKNYSQEYLFTEKWLPFLSRIEREIYGDTAVPLTSLSQAR